MPVKREELELRKISDYLGRGRSGRGRPESSEVMSWPKVCTYSRLEKPRAPSRGSK